jgi:hypothetical protein
MPKQAGAFMKGGLRFKRVQKKVDEQVPDARWWFIATSASFGRQVTAPGSMLFSKENIVAVTATDVLVIPMKGPGVFGTGVSQDSVDRKALDQVECTFDPTSARITLDGVQLNIFSGHEYEAVQVAAICGAEMPDWFVPA